MGSQSYRGSCLCGDVKYKIEGPIKAFQYCHCSRCRKATGSAHASNLFVHPDKFKWLKGKDSVGRYEQPDTKYFANNFCKNCGSTLPWLVQTGVNVVVPAGTLDDDPELQPQQNIFWENRAPWYKSCDDLLKHDQRPK